MEMKVKTALWEVNGEIRRKDDELLREFEELQESECLAVHEKGDNFGHFEDVIYAVPRSGHGIVIFVRREWIPAPGYAWSEIQIKRIEVR